jgi:hypothetical protein
MLLVLRAKSRVPLVTLPAMLPLPAMGSASLLVRCPGSTPELSVRL